MALAVRRSAARLRARHHHGRFAQLSPHTSVSLQRRGKADSVWHHVQRPAAGANPDSARPDQVGSGLAVSVIIQEAEGAETSYDDLGHHQGGRGAGISSILTILVITFREPGR
jgi:hypothetical protein